MTPVLISPEDFISSIAQALQFISYYHPRDFLEHLGKAYEREESGPAKEALAQILTNSKMAATGHRPMCQDTGLVTVFLKVGQQVLFDTERSLQALVNEATVRAYGDPVNPLRASMVRDPLFDRRNTGDNGPAVLHVELVPGRTVEVAAVAKGAGSENKAKFAMLNPGASLADWVVKTVETLGAGWCPPGVLGIGVGGSSEKAAIPAKQSLLDDIDMSDLLARGAMTQLEKMRVEIYERVNALGIGAQGLGGLTTVVDVKIRTFAAHAASLPVALIPQCAANRHVHFTLDGSGPAVFETPDLDAWPKVAGWSRPTPRRVNLDSLDAHEVASWKSGQTLLLSGALLTGRDAAHGRLAMMKAASEPFPVSFKGRALYYVGPVDPVGREAVGPAGPTTAERMDGYTDMMLDEGLLVMIGKAERGEATVESLKRHGAAYLIAVGGAAYLVSKAIKAARKLAFEDLGMEAIYEFQVEDMPVTVAVDVHGNSIHKRGPAQWRETIFGRAEAKRLGDTLG